LALWVDPAEIPADSDMGKLGRALAAGRHGERLELMAYTAAHSGLRWGELNALTIAQVDTAAWVITVDRKVVEVARRLAARIERARAEQEAGASPLGLIFPSPTGKHWRSSNFQRNVLRLAYLAQGLVPRTSRRSHRSLASVQPRGLV
jgi:integrase